MRCISIVRSLYFKIFSASFLITFLSPEIATSISIHYYYYYYYFIQTFYKSFFVHKRVEFVFMKCHYFILHAASPVSCVQTTRIFVLVLMFVVPCLFLAVYHLLVQRFEIFKLQCVLARPPFM